MKVLKIITALLILFSGFAVFYIGLKKDLTNHDLANIIFYSLICILNYITYSNGKESN